MLVRSAAAGAVAILGSESGPGRPPSVAAQTTVSPDEVLKRLMEGNLRFRTGRMTSFADDLRLLKQKTSEKQEPFAAVLSCADSRIPVEIVFDQTIGHVFVTRVAGNVATDEIIGSLEYGVAVLGTRTIMVLGHGSCGAVSASITAKEVPAQISSLYRYIRPAVDRAGSDVDAVSRANTRIQASVLRDSPVIADAIGKGRLKVVAAHYELASGAVTLLS